MKAERLVSPPVLWRLMHWILGKTLPRAVRKECLVELGAYRRAGLGLARQSAAMLVNSYRVQAIAAFNQYSFLVQAPLAVFCFARSSLPVPAGFALASILVALTLRDAYTYHARSSGETLPPMSRYYMDSAGDAATAGLFLLVAETLALKWSPSLALPSPILYHGALVCLPLIPALRMVTRPKPDAKSPFEGLGMPAENIFKKTLRLNILWTGAFNGLMLQNVSDTPGSILDALRGHVPILTIGLWWLLQRDALGRRDTIETLFGHWKKKRLDRREAGLAQGLQKHEPLYWWYVVLEAMIFVELALAEAEVLLPWLSGREAGFLRPGISIAAFTTIVLSWRYVKESNRAAARALREERKKMSAIPA